MNFTPYIRVERKIQIMTFYLLRAEKLPLVVEKTKTKYTSHWGHVLRSRKNDTIS